MSRYGPITFYTSQIYPIENIEGVSAFGDMSIVGQFYDNGLADQVGVSASFIAGVVASSLFSYTNGIPEAAIGGADFLAGTITHALETYSNGVAEGADSGQGQFIAGSWFVALVSYTNYPAEGCNTFGDFIAGHLV